MMLFFPPEKTRIGELPFSSLFRFSLLQKCDSDYAVGFSGSVFIFDLSGFYFCYFWLQVLGGSKMESQVC